MNDKLVRQDKNSLAYMSCMYTLTKCVSLHNVYYVKECIHASDVGQSRSAAVDDYDKHV